MNLVFMFFLGACIGSFLDMCSYRIPRGKGLVLSRSRCESCGSLIGPRDLIPVASYMALAGKCRSCSAELPRRHILTESLSGLFLAAVYSAYGLSHSFFLLSALASVLLVISSIDIAHKIIPDGLNLAVLTIWGMSSAASFFGGGTLDVKDSALGFVTGAGIYLSIYIASRGQMGGGDLKLMSVLGLILGWRLTLVSIMLTFSVAFLASMGFLIAGFKDLKSEIAFGPFISIGSLTALIYGDSIIGWYIGFF